MGQNVLNQISGFLINRVFTKISEMPDFLHVDTSSQKLKVDQKILGWAWSEMGVVNLVMEL